MFMVKDTAEKKLLVVFVQIEFRVRDRLALKKKTRQIQMRQILASFSVLTRYEKFVKTMSSNFSSM